MSWLFSRALVAEYSAASCLDGEQSAPSSSTNTPEMYLWQGKTMDASNLSRYGMTCEHFEGSRGEGLLTWFLAGFPAKTSARQAEQTEKDSKENALDCGSKWPESLARYDRVSRSWKTAQLSLFGGSVEFSETWPRWGMMRGGEFFPLPMLAHDTSVREFGLLRGIGTPIKTQRCRSEDFLKGRVPNPFEICKAENGVPRPEWCESLMLWPDGWSDTPELETGKFRQWFLLHGGISHE